MLLRAALEDDPGDGVAAEALLRILRRGDDANELARVARARAYAATAGPARAEALIDLAEVLEDAAGEVAEADEAYEEAVRQDPSCRVAWMHLERRAAAREDPKALRAALSGQASATSDVMRRGLLLLDAARLALADEDADAAIDLARAAAAGEAGRWRFATELERIAGRAVRADVLAEALLARAGLAAALVTIADGADPDASAVAHVQGAEAAAALSVHLYRRAARVLVDRLGDVPRAEAALRAAAALAPEDPLVAKDRLRVLEAAGRWDEVRSALERDLAGAPAAEQAAVRCRLADVSLRSGEVGAARAHLEAARAADPTSVAVRALLEEHLARGGELGALGELRAADAGSASGPARSFAATIAADLFERGAKDPERALACWALAIEGAPDEWGPRAAKVDLLRRLDRKADLALALEEIAAHAATSANAAAYLRDASIVFGLGGDPAGATRAALGAMREQPDELWPCLLRAIVQLRAGDRTGAADALREGTALAGDQGVAAALGIGAAAISSGGSATGASGTSGSLARDARDRAPGDAFAAWMHHEILRAAGETDAAVASLGWLADSGALPAERLFEAAWVSSGASRPASEAADLLGRIENAPWAETARLVFGRERGDVDAVAAALQRAIGARDLASLEAAEAIELQLRRRPDAASILRASASEISADDAAFPGRWSTADAGEVASLAAGASGVPPLAAMLSAAALPIAAATDAAPSALGPLEKAAALRAPGDPLVRMFSSALAAARGDAEERRAALEALGESAQAVARELVAARVRGAPPRSLVAIARRLFALEPDHPALAITLGSALAPGEEAAARLAGLGILRAAATGPAAADLDVEIAEILESLGKAEESAAAFRSALASHSGDLAAVLGLRRTIRTSGDPAEIAELSERAAALVGDVPEAAPLWEEAGILQEDALGKPTRAEKHYARALALDIGRAEAYRRIHTLLEERGGFEELSDLLARRSVAVDDPEKLVPLLLEQAAVAVERGETDEALAKIEEALLLDPESVAAHGQKARILEDAGEHATAVEAYLAEAACAPLEGKRRARADAARLLAGPLEDPKQAVAVLLDLESVNALDPAHLDIAFAIAQKARLGDEKLAVLRRAAEIHPDAAERLGARRRAATLLEEAHRLDDAAEELRSLLAVAADDEEALAKHADLVVDPTLRQIPLDAAEVAIRARLAVDALAPDALALLGRVHGWRGDRDSRFLITALRSAAGIADEAARSEAAATAASLPDRPTATLPPERILRAIGADDDAPGHRAVLAAIAPFLGKYFDVSPKRFGVGRAERKAASPLREPIAAWAAVFGAPEFEVYVGGSDLGGVHPVPDDPPGLVVGAAVDLGPGSRLALGGALHRIRTGLSAFDGRTEIELVTLLWAAAKIGGATPPALAGLAQAQERLADVLSRKVRNGLAELTGAFLAAGDPLQAVRAERRAALRAGLVACGDPGLALAASDPADRADVARFAASRELAALRRDLGTVIR